MPATIVTPDDNLQDIINQGATDILLIEGVYRLRNFGLMRVTLPRPIQAVGAGARKTVIIGSEDVRDDSLWNKYDSALYWLPLSTPVTITKFGSEQGYEQSDYTIDLIADNTPLRHVTSLDNLRLYGSPAFHYNTLSLALTINFIPSDFESLELTRCDRGFKADKLTGIIISDMSLENFANPAQQGVIDLDFCSAHIEGVETRFGHGVGVKVGSDSIIRNSWLSDNGQQGVNIGGESTDNPALNVTIEECRVERNNFAGFKIDYEAGNKFTFTENLAIRRCYISQNNGHGLWLDAGNIGYELTDNQLLDNVASGIYDEISKGGLIRGNFIARNALKYRADDKLARYGQLWVDTSQGSESVPIDVESNIFTGDCLHLALRNDKRTDYNLEYVNVDSTNQFYGGAISANDIYTKDITGRNLVFNANMYTPDTKLYVQNTQTEISTLDPSAIITDRPTPSDPVYTALPDLDAPIPPQPRPPVITPKTYTIQADILIFGNKVGEIKGTISEDE